MTVELASFGSGVSEEHARELLRQMLLVRRFEEKAAELYSAGHIRGFLHLYVGEEAVGVGAMQALGPEDAVVATYRDHGHALARGLDAGSLMAEMFGKSTGCSRGRGGSMHFFDASQRFYGGYAIVGGGLPIAVGLALADRMQGRERVTACFFGEGAVAEGEFHESLNLAALWRLPVLFLCENNRYAMGTALELSESEPDLRLKAQSYAIPAEAVDGMDVIAVERAVTHAADVVRRGAPYFLELRTYRFRAHSMADPDLYRSKEEIEAWRHRDPLELFAARMEEAGWLDEAGRAALEAAVAGELAAAVAHAEGAPWEALEDLLTDVTTPGGAMIRMTYREAVREALREALAGDPRVFLMGEDVGRYGGAFAVSMGLVDEFGPERVRDTPLSESAFVGAGIGAALGGMRPIVEVMTINFSLLALDQIVNNAATLRYMSGGQFSVPLVVRMATGGGRQLAAQHSHSFEVWYAHVPGIRVLAPATVADARWMLPAALREQDPVFLFEHATLYGLDGEIDGADGPADLDHAAVRRAGDDATIAAWGGSLGRALEAAEALAARGIEAEVIDLRTLRPLDVDTLLRSLARTHRLVVVDESWRAYGVAAEVAAQVTELGFDLLDGPVLRVCSAEAPMPYAKHLEQAALPRTDAVVDAVLASLGERG